MRARAMRAPAP
ncbi:unnamed protein product, partial [Didymodactylos carnosus]